MIESLPGISEESKRKILRDNAPSRIILIRLTHGWRVQIVEKVGKGEGRTTVSAGIGLAGTFFTDFALKRGERLVLVDFLLQHDFVETMFRGTEVAVSL